MQLTSGVLYIAQISGIITVIAGTIYVLGLFALLLPILHKYEVDFENAWYMVSLVPKTVIAGHGVKSLVWPALFTVIPIAFIVVLVLMLRRIVSVGVRRGRDHASAIDNSEHLSGVPFITAIYLAYSGVLGGILLAIHKVAKGTNVPGAFLQFHSLAGALAYAILAVLCLLTLALLTWRVGRRVIDLILTKNVTYRSLKALGSVKLSLYLALYLGMVCVALSGVFLVDALVRGELSAEMATRAVFSAWTIALTLLAVLAPAMLTLLLLNNVLSSELLDSLGAGLARIGAVLKGLLSVASFGSALVLIFLSCTAMIVAVLPRHYPLFEALFFCVIGDLLVILSLFAMVLLLLPLGRVIPLEAFGGAGATIRFVFIAVTVVCTTLLCWSLVWLVRISVQGEFSRSIWPWLLFLFSLLFFVGLGAIVLILLVARGVRYMLRTLTGTSHVAFTSSNGSGGSLSVRANKLRISLRRLREGVDDEVFAITRYMATLFGAFYFTLLVAFLHGRYIMWPLIDNINPIYRSGSVLDQLYFYLTIVVGIASGTLLYRGLFPPRGGPTGQDLLSTKDWRTFVSCFWKTERPRPQWGWVVWSIIGAYAFSVILGSLIAYLEEPPLPEVQVVEKGAVVRPDVSASTEEPGFHSSTHSLLAHTDGYWYLLNEDGNLVVIPDQSDGIIRMPRYVDAVDDRGSLKVDVPSGWDEQLSGNNPPWPEGSAPPKASSLTVSTNVDNWGAEYDTPGAFVGVYSDDEWYKWWGKPVDDVTVDQVSIDDKETYSPDCHAPDEGPAVYDLENEDRLYTAKIVRWRDCDRGHGYLATLVAVPKNRSFVLRAQVRFEGDESIDYDAETDLILRSIEVKSDLLP